MKFKSRKTKIIEANQYLKRGELPLGLRTREDGSTYVVTIQGQEVTVHLGEWVVQESDGIHYYPISRDEFPFLYEPIKD